MKTRRRSGMVPSMACTCGQCPGCKDENGNSKAHAQKKRRISSTNTNVICSNNLAVGESIPTCSNDPGDTDHPVVVTCNKSEIDVDSDSAATFELLQIDEDIMKVDTKNYCLFCYKPCTFSLQARNRNEGDKDDVQRKEICSRYLKLLTRHLKLNIYRHITSDNFFTTSLKKDESNFEITSCDACFIILESFCNLYHQLQNIQLQLDWNVVKLRNIMRCAEKVPSRVNEFREKVLNGDHGMKKEEQAVMNAFKREFFRNSVPKRYPRVALERVGRKRKGSNGEMPKRKKTILVQRHPGLPGASGELGGVEANKGNSIQVLEIGQELTLSTRGRSNVGSIPVESQQPISSSHLNRVVSVSAPDVDLQNPAQKSTTKAQTPIKLASMANSPFEPGKAMIKKPDHIAVSYRPCPASRKGLEKRRKRPTVIQVHPRVQTARSNPDSANKSCEVIDLCESDNEENGKEVDNSAHSPAKQMKTTTAPAVPVDSINTSPSPPPPVQGTEGENVIISPLPLFETNLPPTAHVLGSSSNDNFDNQDPSIQSYHSPPSMNYGPSPSQDTCPVEMYDENLQQNESAPFPNPVDAFNEFQHPYQAPFQEPEPPNLHEELPEHQPTPGEFMDFNDYNPPHSEAFPQNHFDDFPIPPEQPVDGIGIQGVRTMTYTVTHTLTSTITGIPPEVPLPDNFIPPVFPIFEPASSHAFVSGQEPNVGTEFPPQSNDYFQSNNYSSNDLNGSFSNVTPENYFESTIPTSQPIVTEVDDDNHYNPTNPSQDNPEIIEDVTVQISEVIDDDIDDNDEVTVILQSNAPSQPEALDVTNNHDGPQNNNDVSNAQNVF